MNHCLIKRNSSGRVNRYSVKGIVMKKCLLILVILLSALLCAYASGYEAGASLDMMGMLYNGTFSGADLAAAEDAFLGDLPSQSYKNTALWLSEAKAYIKASGPDLKGEVKGLFSVARMGESGYYGVLLEKGYVKFRIPSLFKSKTTITVGKAPISWGLGTYYRVGDVLISDMSRNEKAGESDSRNIWLLDISQNLGSGWAADAALSIPLEDQKLAGGLTIRKSFSAKYLKSLHGFYSFSDGNVHTAAFAADMNLYFDITAGVQSSFRSTDDCRVALNLMKQYTVEGEASSCSIGLYLSSELDFYKKNYDIMTALSVAPTDRTSVYISAVNRFSESSYRGVMVNASVSFLAVDGVRLKAGGIYGYNNKLSVNSYAGYIGIESVF